MQHRRREGRVCRDRAWRASPPLPPSLGKGEVEGRSRTREKDREVGVFWGAGGRRDFLEGAVP